MPVRRRLTTRRLNPLRGFNENGERRADVIVSSSTHRRFAGAGGLACALVAALAQPLGAEQDANVLAQASSGPLRCEIRKDDKGDSVELIGLAASTRAIAGSAQLNLAKSGPCRAAIKVRISTCKQISGRSSVGRRLTSDSAVTS